MTEDKTVLWIGVLGVAALLMYRAMQGTAIVLSHSIVDGGASGSDDTTDHVIVPSVRRLGSSGQAARIALVSGSGATAPGGTGGAGYAAPSVSAAAPSSATVTAPSAASPGGSPSAFNPNVAGPVLAPTGDAPIPSYSDPVLVQSTAIDMFVAPTADPLPITTQPLPPSPLIIYDPTPTDPAPVSDTTVQPIDPVPVADTGSEGPFLV